MTEDTTTIEQPEVVTSGKSELRQRLETKKAELEEILETEREKIKPEKRTLPAILAPAQIQRTIEGLRGIRSYDPDLVEIQIEELKELLQEVRDKEKRFKDMQEVAQVKIEEAGEELALIRSGLSALDTYESGKLLTDIYESEEEE